MTAEKWMRKTTQKKFRRLDVVLRNEIKCCIIDWKFSQSSAENKISDRRVNLKNMIYYQLASKDFLTNNVELKFYCIHARSSQHYHDYSVAMYRHQIEEVELDPI